MIDDVMPDPETERVAFEMRCSERRVRDYNNDKRLLPPAMFDAKWPVPPAEEATA